MLGLNRFGPYFVRRASDLVAVRRRGTWSQVDIREHCADAIMLQEQ